MHKGGQISQFAGFCICGIGSIRAYLLPAAFRSGHQSAEALRSAEKSRKGSGIPCRGNRTGSEKAVIPGVTGNSNPAPGNTESYIAAQHLFRQTARARFRKQNRARFILCYAFISTLTSSYSFCTDSSGFPVKSETATIAISAQMNAGSSS